MMYAKVPFWLVLSVALTALSYPCAAEITPALKTACKNDYKKFCGIYAINDPGMRQCMDGAGPSLSKGCVDAMVEAGEVSRKRVMQRWKQH